MILQDEFISNGYVNILDDKNNNDNIVDLEGLFDAGDIPKELLGIYISKNKDELFFVLDGEALEINELCDKWDDHIRVFTIINGKDSIICTLKYNIVQLIIYSNGKPDKNREGNLFITRKIILKGDLSNRNQIVIGDDEAIELPFHMIPDNAISPSPELISALEDLLPKDIEILNILKKQRTKVKKTFCDDVYKKSLDNEEFEIIRGWFNHVN